MKVKIIPGPRDEEKIRAIMNARETLSASEWEEFCSCCVSTHDDTWFDALYHVNESKYSNEIPSFLRVALTIGRMSRINIQNRFPDVRVSTLDKMKG